MTISIIINISRTGFLTVMTQCKYVLQPQHVQTMQRALERLSRRFPTAGLVLQLGDKFYEHRDGELREVPWVGATPPPVVTRMSAINLPRHGTIFLYPTLD